jgi:hypothetical protein
MLTAGDPSSPSSGHIQTRCLCVCVCVCVFVCVYGVHYIHMYVCVCVHIQCIYIYIIHKHKHKHTHTHTHTRTHTLYKIATHTHTHTHTQTKRVTIRPDRCPAQQQPSAAVTDFGATATGPLIPPNFIHEQVEVAICLFVFSFEQPRASE